MCAELLQPRPGFCKAVLAAGDPDLLVRLLANDVGPPITDRGESLLHLASSYHFAKNQAAMIEVLLAAGLDVNATDGHASTPLFWAVGSGCEDCVSRLLVAGADVKATNGNGMTALHVANSAIAQQLLNHGADAKARDNEGNVPLHYQYHSPLLGAGVNVRNRFGLTPLHIAALTGNHDGIAWLLAHGADPAAESTAVYGHNEGILAHEFDPVLKFGLGSRPYDIARQQHDRTEWATGKYRRSLGLLDDVTPRRGWLSR